MTKNREIVLVLCAQEASVDQKMDAQKFIKDRSILGGIFIQPIFYNDEYKRKIIEGSKQEWAESRLDEIELATEIWVFDDVNNLSTELAPLVKYAQQLKKPLLFYYGDGKGEETE